MTVVTNLGKRKCEEDSDSVQKPPAPDLPPSDKYNFVYYFILLSGENSD